MKKNVSLILASASPRRRDLLELAGLNFVVVVADVLEEILPGEDPSAAALRLSLLKAKTIGALHPMNIVLGADTIVTLPLSEESLVQSDFRNAQILGKPATEQEAVQMLELLSGRRHAVITGYTLYRHSPSINFSRACMTIVEFRRLTSREILKYVSSGEPMDKAGAYGIQGRASSFVSTLSGSYTNVVGLPLAQVVEDLRKLEDHQL